MESNVDKLTTLLNKSEVNAVLLDLLLLLFDKLLRPDGLVLDINIVDKHIVEVKLVLVTIIQCEFVLRFSKCFLNRSQLNIFIERMYIITIFKRFGMI